LAGVIGTIALDFDFASGSLSGSISPRISVRTHVHSLPTLSFSHTVYSSGSTTFSGTFDTTIAGVNSFAGLFAGPSANEVVGSFAFPYLSPHDQSPQQASGAFTATKGP
jgi:hypothetical protein